MRKLHQLLVKTCYGEAMSFPADATNHREREAADLRAYADHREPVARERMIRD